MIDYPRAPQSPVRYRINRSLVKILLLVVTSTAALAALALPIALRPTTFPLQVGDVSSQDILAPRSLTYESETLTQQARQQALARVAPVYLPADPSIARHQLERMRVVLNYISIVRLDTYATLQQKEADLQAAVDMDIQRDLADRILSLNDFRWQAVQQETSNVLEQTMRNTIREDAIPDARRNLPTLVSFALPQDQAALVVDLVSPFVVANSLYSAEKTEANRQQVLQAVTPVKRTFVAGETIVLRGQIINQENWESLQRFGLVKPKNNDQDLLASAAMVLVISAFVALYFNRRQAPPVDDLRSLAVLCVNLMIFLVGARYLIPNRAVLPFLYPLPAFGMVLAALFNMEIGLVFSVIISILAAYGLPNSLDLTLYYMLASLCGVLVLGRARRIASFMYAGFATGAAGIGIILAQYLPNSVTDWLGLATLSGAAVFNGMASASLALLFQFLLSQVLGLTTALQLLEVSRPDHPLLQFMLQNAPGTYQHSLQVANLAEQAAEKIGADSLLTRVGAIFHDSGKSVNPNFFIENQVPGQLDSHDDVDPAMAAATIIRHVTDGVQLGRKYRLPPRLTDFMREHHGTLLTRYQYTKAVESAGGPEFVDQKQFQYPGPRPRSKETALLMLADGVEARARAELPRGEDELRTLVKGVFDYIQREGQLDETRLTLRDLSLAAESFVTTLRNTYHPRIQYPELKPPVSLALPPESPAEKTVPLLNPKTIPRKR